MLTYFRYGCFFLLFSYIRPTYIRTFNSCNITGNIYNIMKLNKKSLLSAEKQAKENTMLVSEIKDTMNWLEPELTNEQILTKLVVMLTPMCETPILNALNKFLNSLRQKKLNEVADLYEQFFNDEATENNN